MPVGTTLPATSIETAADRTPTTSSSIVIENQSGALYASLRFARARALRFEFALDVVNATPHPLLATVYVQPALGEEVPVAPFSVWIDPHTEAYVYLPLPVLALVTCRTFIVRLQGRGVHQVLHAAIPRPSALLWSCAGAAAAVLVIGAAVLLQPSVARVEVPASVLAGSHIDVTYGLRNSRAGTWELDDLHGGRHDGGALAETSGRFGVTIPRANDREAYVLNVRAQGLGVATRSVPLVADTPQPSGPPLRVSALSVDQAVIPDGGSVRLRYRTDATSGEVTAVDAQGTIWARAPLNRNGVTTLKLPVFGKDKELQVRVIARRGTQLAQAGVGIQITATPTGLSSGAGPAIALGADSVHPGEAVTVRILHYVDGLRVALVDRSGVEIDVRQVQPGDASVTLRVPFSVSGLFSVVASYARGDTTNTESLPLHVVRE